MLDALPEHLRAQAARRYAASGPLLEQRLGRLYGHCDGYAGWLGDLLAAVGRLHAARSPELHALDTARAATPDWFASQTMLGYSAYVAQFGGTLQGVTRRIDHLRDLGVTYLHLLPFLRARAGENDGGFAVASFDEVEPALGSEADLLALTRALRTAGISLCSDLVLNHVADDHAWALGAAAGDTALRDYFHVFPDRRQPDRYEETLAQIFPEAAPGNFTWIEAMGGWVWTTFYPFQWDLNYANPQVLSGMLQSLLGLANKGIEVFRLDSTAFLWKREGTNCMNQPEAHELLQVMRAIVDIAAPGVLLKAEAIVPTRELPAYFGNSAAPECHLAYHSTLMAAGWAALAEQDATLLRTVIATTPALPPAASWLTYVRCHDDIGWNVLRAEANDPARLAAVARFYSAGDSYPAGVPFQTSAGHAVHGTNGSAAALAGLDTAGSGDADGDGDGAGQHGGIDHAVRRLVLLHGLAMSFGGLPMLYMGDELGMENDHTYLNDPARAHDTRWVQRAPFDEARFASRRDAASSAGKVYLALRGLIEQRRGKPELSAGVPCELLDAGDCALLAFKRGERFLSLSNFSGRNVPVELLGHSLVLGPWQMRWIALSEGQQ